MNLTKILAISGKPGLYRLETQTRTGFLATSLVDDKRISVGIRNNVSLLSEIAIYTTEKEIPLSEVFEKIKKMIDLINEKYGIPKRWRADYDKIFYFIESYGEANCISDVRAESDTSKYELGNYFKTKEEAQKVIDSKEWKEFWEKVRNEEIGGDE